MLCRSGATSKAPCKSNSHFSHNTVALITTELCGCSGRPGRTWQRQKQRQRVEEGISLVYKKGFSFQASALDIGRSAYIIGELEFFLAAS